MGIFRIVGATFSSLNKSRKLRGIYNRIEKHRHGETTQNASGELRQAREDLIQLVLNDNDLRKIMSFHGVGEESAIRDLYHALEEAGAAHYSSDGHYVAGSGIAFGCCLDFVLRNREELLKDPSSNEARRIAQRLIRYFENGEQGLINSY